MSFQNKLIFSDAPVSWQLGFQNPATPVMEGIISLHNYIMMYLILVFVVVVWFLARSIYLFYEGCNSESMEFNHDPVIETVWTIAPAFILVAIAAPSFALLYSMDEVVEPSLTVKVVGHQWYWSYELDAHRKDFLYEYWAAKCPKIKRYIDSPQYVAVEKHLHELPSFKVAKNPLVKFYKSFIVNVKPKPKLYDLSSQISKSKIQVTHKLGLLLKSKKTLKGVRIMYKFVDVRDIVNRKIVKELRLDFHWMFEFLTKFHQVKYSVAWINPSVKFDSYMLSESDLPKGGLRLLEVDNRLVLPDQTHIRLLVTSSDVIHSWAVPSLGIKVDAIPGRLNQTELFIKRSGVYYGQCSELCGVNHGFMPIVVEAVDYREFGEWVRAKSNYLKLSDYVNSVDWDVRVE